MKRRYNKSGCQSTGTVYRGGMKTTTKLLTMVAVSLSLLLATTTPARAIGAPQRVPNPPVQSSEPKQPVTIADVKALVKGEISDEVIESQIRSNHAVFHLTTEDILDLKKSGVSEKLIDCMINTASHT